MPAVILSLLPLLLALMHVDWFRSPYWLAVSAMSFGGTVLDLQISVAVARAPQGGLVGWSQEHGYFASLTAP